MMLNALKESENRCNCEVVSQLVVLLLSCFLCACGGGRAFGHDTFDGKRGWMGEIT